MPFGNPIIGGGGDLVRKAIKSPNYVPGVSGWAINQDGSAEFQNVIIPGGGSVSISALTSGSLSADADLASGSIRSAASGTRIVLDAAGLRLYSGASNTINLDASTGNALFTGQVQTAVSGARVTLNPVGRIDMQNASGASGTLNVDGAGNVTLTSNSGNYLNVGAGGVTGNSSAFFGSLVTNGISCNGITDSGNASVSGSLSAGSMSCSSASLSGSFSGTHSGSWSGSISPSSVSTGSFSGSGGAWSGAVAVGSAGSQTSIQGSTVLFGNIPFTGATGVAANFNGRFIQGVSSTRASKTEITDAEITPAEVLQLRPVSFYAREQVDAAGGDITGLVRHFGFIAEEVDEIPAARPLVIHDDQGHPVSVGYERVTAVQQVVLLDHEERLARQAVELEQLRGLVAELERRLAVAGIA